MDEPTKSAIVIETEDNPHIFNRILKIIAYPIAAVSGLWVVKKEVSDTVYDDLKRGKAFDDILEDLQPKNEANVASRGKSAIGIE